MSKCLCCYSFRSSEGLEIQKQADHENYEGITFLLKAAD